MTSKIPTLKDGAVKLVRGEDEKVPPVYTAAGVFITSFARELTIRAAQTNYDTFAYADTDSLHLLQPEAPDSIEVHPTKLGAWKFEYAFDSAFYIRAKAYLEHLPNVDPYCDDYNEWVKEKGEIVRKCEDRHDYVTRIAGLPTPIAAKLSFDQLREGLVLHGKLNPRTVPGGVVLKNVPFELKLS